MSAVIPIELGSAQRVKRNLGMSINVRTPLTEQILKLTDPNLADSEWLHDYRLKNLPNIMRGLDKIQKAETHNIPFFFGSLYLVKRDNDGLIWDYGLVSCRLVTNNGVNAIIDAFQNTFTLANFRYHGIGTTNTAEASTDAALAAELTTVYNPDNTRASGTLTEGGSANIFRTVGTNVVDGAATIVEHGLFSQQATGGGTLLDRSVFTGIGLVSGNSLQSTYDLTMVAGG